MNFQVNHVSFFGGCTVKTPPNLKGLFGYKGLYPKDLPRSLEGKVFKAGSAWIKTTSDLPTLKRHKFKMYLPSPIDIQSSNVRFRVWKP